MSHNLCVLVCTKNKNGGASAGARAAGNSGGTRQLQINHVAPACATTHTRAHAEAIHHARYVQPPLDPASFSVSPTYYAMSAQSASKIAWKVPVVDSAGKTKENWVVLEDKNSNVGKLQM